MFPDQLRAIIDKAILTPQDSVAYCDSKDTLPDTPWCVLRFGTLGPRSFLVIAIHIQTDFTYYVGLSVLVTTPEALDILAAYARAYTFLDKTSRLIKPRNPYVL